jgi:hypothetical protein
MHGPSKIFSMTLKHDYLFFVTRFGNKNKWLTYNIPGETITP